jgi:predicted nuclease of predicted toxin-antitoxin system
MKLLIDENLPKKLKHRLPGHEVYHIRDKTWHGKKNGELLRLMLAEGFGGLLTFDKNVEHQQNFVKYPIAVLVLNAPRNDFDTLAPLLPVLLRTLDAALPARATVIQS